MMAERRGKKSSEGPSTEKRYRVSREGVIDDPRIVQAPQEIPRAQPSQSSYQQTYQQQQPPYQQPYQQPSFSAQSTYTAPTEYTEIGPSQHTARGPYDHTAQLSSSSSSSSSYLDISRTFPERRPRGLGAIRTFFTTPSERRRVKRRRSRRSLGKHSNSSSSSLDENLAYGTGFIRKSRRDRLRRRSSQNVGRQYRDGRSSAAGQHRDGRSSALGQRRDGRSSATGQRRESRAGASSSVPTDAAIIAMGVELAAIARKQNRQDLQGARNSGVFPVKRQGTGVWQETETSRGLGSSKISHGELDEDGWESASDGDSDSSSADSNLAFGGDAPATGWGWGSKRQTPKRKSTVVDPTLFGPANSLHGVVSQPVGFQDVLPDLSIDPPTLADLDAEKRGSAERRDPTERREARRAERADSNASSQPLQYVYPMPTSDPSRFDAGRGSVVTVEQERYPTGRPAPVPIQQPQPVTPVSSKVFSTQSETDVRRKDSTSGRSSSIAGAALAGVAASAIGAAIIADRRDDRKDKRREEESREIDRKEKDKRRDSTREDDRRRDSQSAVSTRSRDEERERRRADKKKYPNDTREQRRERRRLEDEIREIEERKERRRREEREVQSEGERRRISYRDDPREDQRQIEYRTEPRDTVVRSSGTVDPFQYQVADDAFETPQRSRSPETAIEAPVSIVTVAREPSFARKRSSSIKETGDRYTESKNRDNDRDDGALTRQETDAMNVEINNFTAPIAIGAIGAAVAAVTAEEKRHTRRPSRDRKDRRKAYGASSEKERDYVQEEADRVYREMILAQNMASTNDKEEEGPPRIVTPPGYEKHKKGPFDAPDADFQLDKVMTPIEFKGFTPISTRAYPSSQDFEPHRQDSAEFPSKRPMLTLVQPTPVPTPTPERQRDRSNSRSSKDRSRDVEQSRKSSEPSDVEVLIGPKGDIIVQPAASSSSTPTTARSVTWGQNEHRTYEVESPGETRDEFIDSKKKQLPKSTQYDHSEIIVEPEISSVVSKKSDSDRESRPAPERKSSGSKKSDRDSQVSETRSDSDRKSSSSSASSSKKSTGWGMIAGAILGAGAVEAVKDSKSDSKKDSKSDREKDAKSEISKSQQSPYEYRGVVVEPDTLSKHASRDPSPPAVGPKPTMSTSAAPSSHMPGSFDDDLDFSGPSPAGTFGSALPPHIYQAPYAETVSDLGTIRGLESPSHEGAPPVQGFVVGELPETPREPVADDEFTTKLSKKEQKKRDKAAKRASMDADTPVEDLSSSRQLVEEPESYFEPSSSSKKDKKKSKKSKRDSAAWDDEEDNATPKVTVPIDAFDDLRHVEAPTDVVAAEEWESSKKKKKSKRDSGRYESPVRSVEPADVPIPASSEVSRYTAADDDWEDSSSKKKKSKRDSGRFESPARDPAEYPLPATSEVSRYSDWEDSSSKKKSKGDDDAYAALSRNIPADVPLPTASDVTRYDDDDTSARKKKTKRDSSRHDSPTRDPADYPLPATSEVSRYDEDETPSRKKKSKRDSSRYDSPARDPSEYPLPATSVVGADDYDEFRSSRKSKSRERSQSVASRASTRYDGDSDGGKSSKSTKKRDKDKDRDRDKDKEKEKKSGGFFGLFGSSSSKSEPEKSKDKSSHSKDDLDLERKDKKDKKAKRRSVADASELYGDLGSQSISDLSQLAKTTSNGRTNDDYEDGERRRKRSSSKSSSNGHKSRRSDDENASKEESFLAKAGTLGAGVGIAGAAVAMAVQHQQNKADVADKRSKQRSRSRSSISHGDPPQGSEPEPEKPASTLGQEVVDPEIAERDFRPSIDPQYGDLLPLPPSLPGSPELEQDAELPVLPESRPTSPQEEELRRRERPTVSIRKVEHQTPMKSPSQSAIPLKFMMGRAGPSSPKMTRSSPAASPSADSPETQRPRSRPSSWDTSRTKGFQPLFLVDKTRRESIAQIDLQDPRDLQLGESHPESSSSQPSDYPALARESTAETLGAVAAGAGTAAVATAIGLSRSENDDQDPKELVPLATEQAVEPSPVEADTKNRSSYLFQPTPPKAGFRDATLDPESSSPTQSRSVDSDAAIERKEIGIQRSNTLDALESISQVEKPDTADDFGFTKSKKDKKKDKKGKKSRSSTLDDVFATEAQEDRDFVMAVAQPVSETPAPEKDDISEYVPLTRPVSDQKTPIVQDTKTVEPEEDFLPTKPSKKSKKDKKKDKASTSTSSPDDVVPILDTSSASRDVQESILAEEARIPTLEPAKAMSYEQDAPRDTELRDAARKLREGLTAPESSGIADWNSASQSAEAVRPQEQSEDEFFDITEPKKNTKKDKKSKRVATTAALAGGLLAAAAITSLHESHDRDEDADVFHSADEAGTTSRDVPVIPAEDGENFFTPTKSKKDKKKKKRTMSIDDLLAKETPILDAPNENTDISNPPETSISSPKDRKDRRKSIDDLLAEEAPATASELYEDRDVKTVTHDDAPRSIPEAPMNLPATPVEDATDDLYPVKLSKKDKKKNRKASSSWVDDIPAVESPVESSQETVDDLKKSLAGQDEKAAEESVLNPEDLFFTTKKSKKDKKKNRSSQSWDVEEPAVEPIVDDPPAANPAADDEIENATASQAGSQPPIDNAVEEVLSLKQTKKNKKKNRSSLSWDAEEPAVEDAPSTSRSTTDIEPVTFEAVNLTNDVEDEWSSSKKSKKDKKKTKRASLAWEDDETPASESPPELVSQAEQSAVVDSAEGLSSTQPPSEGHAAEYYDTSKPFAEPVLQTQDQAQADIVESSVHDKLEPVGHEATKVTSEDTLEDIAPGKKAKKDKKKKRTSLSWDDEDSPVADSTTTEPTLGAEQSRDLGVTDSAPSSIDSDQAQSLLQSAASVAVEEPADEIFSIKKSKKDKKKSKRASSAQGDVSTSPSAPVDESSHVPTADEAVEPAIGLDQETSEASLAPETIESDQQERLLATAGDQSEEIFSLKKSKKDKKKSKRTSRSWEDDNSSSTPPIDPLEQASDVEKATTEDRAEHEANESKSEIIESVQQDPFFTAAESQADELSSSQKSKKDKKKAKESLSWDDIDALTSTPSTELEPTAATVDDTAITEKADSKPSSLSLKKTSTWGMITGAILGTGTSKDKAPLNAEREAEVAPQESKKNKKRNSVTWAAEPIIHQLPAGTWSLESLTPDYSDRRDNDHEAKHDSLGFQEISEPVQASDEPTDPWSEPSSNKKGKKKGKRSSISWADEDASEASHEDIETSERKSSNDGTSSHRDVPIAEALALAAGAEAYQPDKSEQEPTNPIDEWSAPTPSSKKGKKKEKRKSISWEDDEPAASEPTVVEPADSEAPDLAVASPNVPNDNPDDDWAAPASSKKGKKKGKKSSISWDDIPAESSENAAESNSIAAMEEPIEIPTDIWAETPTKKGKKKGKKNAIDWEHLDESVADDKPASEAATVEALPVVEEKPRALDSIVAEDPSSLAQAQIKSSEQEEEKGKKSLMPWQSDNKEPEVEALIDSVAELGSETQTPTSVTHQEIEAEPVLAKDDFVSDWTAPKSSKKDKKKGKKTSTLWDAEEPVASESISESPLQMSIQSSEIVPAPEAAPGNLGNDDFSTSSKKSKKKGKKNAMSWDDDVDKMTSSTSGTVTPIEPLEAANYKSTEEPMDDDFGFSTSSKKKKDKKKKRDSLASQSETSQPKSILELSEALAAGTALPTSNDADLEEPLQENVHAQERSTQETGLSVEQTPIDKFESARSDFSANEYFPSATSLHSPNKNTAEGSTEKRSYFPSAAALLPFAAVGAALGLISKSEEPKQLASSEKSADIDSEPAKLSWADEVEEEEGNAIIASPVTIESRTPDIGSELRGNASTSPTPDGLKAGYNAEQLELARQMKEEFAAGSSKKSKKGKKSHLSKSATEDDYLSRETSQDPQERKLLEPGTVFDQTAAVSPGPDGLQAGYNAEQLELARQMKEEFAAGSSKKSKKGKKNRNSLPTPQGYDDATSSYFDEPQQVADEPDEQPVEPEHSVTPRVENPDGFNAGYNAEQLELARQMREEFAAKSSKKSKKSKKDRSSSQTPQGYDEAMSSYFDEPAPSDEQTQRELSQEPENMPPPTLENPDGLKAGYNAEQLELARQMREEFAAASSKKDKKKDKKRGSLLRSVTDDNFNVSNSEEPSQPASEMDDSLKSAADETAEEISTAKKSKKDKKSKKSKSLSNSMTEDDFNISTVETIEAVSAAQLEPTYAPIDIPAEDAADFGFSSKKSRKDKKGKKSRDSSSFMAEEEPRGRTEATEDDTILPSVETEKGLPSTDVNSADFSLSSKKSKKDKKDKKESRESSRAATEEPLTIEKSIDSSFPAVAVDNADRALLDVDEQVDQQVELAAEPDEFEFSTKKSKKDKKKKGKDTFVSQEPESQTEPSTGLSTAAEDDVTFSPITKKSKKDKKGRKGQSWIDDIATPDAADTGAVVESVPITMANSAEVEHQQDMTLAEVAPATEEADDSGFSTKKSKKDKKSQSLIRSATFDADDVSALTEVASIDKDYEAGDLKPTTFEAVTPVVDMSSGNPDDEFTFAVKTSKKEKKKNKKNASAFDENDTSPFTTVSSTSKEAAEKSMPLESANLTPKTHSDDTTIQEKPGFMDLTDFSNTKKSKNDKKKAENSFETVVAAPVEIKESQPKKVEASYIISETAAAPVHKLSSEQLHKFVAEEPLQVESTADEDLGISSQKSKKGKKKGKVSALADFFNSGTAAQNILEEPVPEPSKSATPNFDVSSQESPRGDINSGIIGTAAAAAAAGLGATALLSSKSEHSSDSVADSSASRPEAKRQPSQDVPAFTKKSKKDKRRKIIDRRSSGGDDLFDDPALWEGPDPTPFEEHNDKHKDSMAEESIRTSPDPFKAATNQALDLFPESNVQYNKQTLSEAPGLLKMSATSDPFESATRQALDLFKDDTTTPNKGLSFQDSTGRGLQTDYADSPTLPRDVPDVFVPAQVLEPEDIFTTTPLKRNKKSKKSRPLQWEAPTTPMEEDESSRDLGASIFPRGPETEPPMLPTTPSQSHFSIKSSDHSAREARYSTPTPLPVVFEEHSSASHDKHRSQHRHSLEASNRDSGFVTDSPNIPQRGFAHDTEASRDSGFRDWSPAPSDRPRHSSALTDDALTSRSWPKVDDESQSVDLNPSTRSQAQHTPKYSANASVPIAAAAAAAAGLAIAKSRSHKNLSDVDFSGTSPEFRQHTPDIAKNRPGSVNSIRSSASGTPSLRRSDRKLSGDLRSLSQRSASNLAKDAKDAERGSPATSSILNDSNPIANEGRVRAKEMADVYDGFGEGRIGSPMSPTRPHSMRRRQSMQVLDLEARVEQMVAENRVLMEEKAQAERQLVGSQRAANTLADKEAELDNLKSTLDWLHKEVERLKEVNDGLQSANITLGNQHNDRYSALQLQHAESTRELEETREAHGSLSKGMDGIVANSTAEKDREISQLRKELQAAQATIRSMQEQILSAKSNDNEYLTLRDEDYFDNACQQLCQHVQQWVLRFSKFSDMRACRLTSEINNDKIIDRLDNAVLDGSDVDIYLSDRVKRRDIFMSMTMTMIWEFVFTRYLFGMDREQRQKLKSLEKTLSEVGPPAAVHQWRATTLTLLAKREAFVTQREQDTEAVVQMIFQTLSEILPPPGPLEDQIQDQLRRVMRAAVDLSIEMRTQRAEYMMLPPLQPEYDANGDLARQVSFNASLMNERSGDTTSNDDLESQSAVVRVVLFPLVVKRGDDRGVGDEEIVVCPAQVLVAKSKKSVRIMSAGSTMSVAAASRVSMQSPAGEGPDGMI